MRIIFRLVILSLFFLSTNSFAGEIIRIKKVKKENRNRYNYSVTYNDASSESLKAKLLARKYGEKKAVKAERSEDGLQVKLIKINR